MTENIKFENHADKSAHDAAKKSGDEMARIFELVEPVKNLDPNEAAFSPEGQGRFAKLDGKSESDNPYNQDMDPELHQRWTKGFKAKPAEQ